MADKTFIDTNILVYAHDATAGFKHKVSKKIIEETWDNKTGCISIQVLQEFYVTVTQKVPRPMEKSTALEIIQGLQYWKIHEPKTDDVYRAIEIQQRYKTSFWDAMILQSARFLECKEIWTEDLNPGQLYNNVLIVNPFL